MNKAEELIACLEGEIAKRDARIAELEADLTGTQSRVLSLQNQWRKQDAELAAIKAQGVVMPGREECDDDRKHPNSWTDHAIGWNACIDEVARLNAAPAQQVSVPDGWKLVPVNATEAILDVLYSNGMDESDSLLQDIWSAMIAAAPAAPAADAGVTSHD